MPDDRPLEGYLAEVLVEDVTLADAPARIVNSVHVPATDLPRAGRRLGPVDIEVDPPSLGKQYNLRGLLTRGPHPRAGDLMSTRAIPVVCNAEVKVPLTRIS